MWSRLYRDHFIMAFPSFDTATNAWAPQADISWNGGPARQSEFVRFPKRFMSEGEAVSFALKRGEAWINHRLRRFRRDIPPERRRVIDIIAALKENLNQDAPRLEPRATVRRRERAFTFEQFKSAIARSGLNISRDSLQKSYAALVKLREHNHLSWAETRRKVERSRQDLRAGQSPMRRPRRARLPLTEDGWRRIG